MKIETLVQIMAEEVDHYDTSAQGLIHAAKRILAALEAERVGEVVLMNGADVDKVCVYAGVCDYDGKNGSLIFRPEVER